MQAVFRELLPIVEVTHKSDGGGMGSVFAKHPAIGSSMQTEIMVCVSEIGQCA